MSSKALQFFPPPRYANVFFLFLKKKKIATLFRNFISIIFYFTPKNIFSNSQEVHFPCVCFDKWNGNCALQSASKISDEKAARSKKLPVMLQCS